MQLVMVLFFVPWEGSLMITSSLLTFAGTDCNVSGSFPMSKHIRETQGKVIVFMCVKILLTCNAVR